MIRTVRDVEGGRYGSARRQHVDVECVALRQAEQGVAAGRDGDIFSAADRVGDRRGVDAGRAARMPEPQAGRRVERIEVAGALAREDDPFPRSRACCVDQRGRARDVVAPDVVRYFLKAPAEGAGPRVERDERARPPIVARSRLVGELR